MKVKSESEVAQSCPTPNDPMACSLPGLQTPPSMGFSRQEYWSELPLPSLALSLGTHKVDSVFYLKITTLRSFMNLTISSYRLLIQPP